MADREVTPYLEPAPRLEVAEALDRTVEKLEASANKTPKELREFFYSDEGAMLVDEIIKAVRLFGTPGNFVPHREVTHPEFPDVLKVAVHARIYPNGRRGVFLLHAVGVQDPANMLFVPIEASGHIARPKIVDHFRLAEDRKTTEKERHTLEAIVEWEGQHVSLHKAPHIALSALTETTRRLRSIIGNEDLQLVPVVHNNQLLAEAFPRN